MSIGAGAQVRRRQSQKHPWRPAVITQCKERIAAHKNTVDEIEIMKFISWLKTPIDAYL